MENKSYFEYFVGLVGVLFLLYNGYGYYADYQYNEIVATANELKEVYDSKYESDNHTEILLARDELSAYLEKHRVLLDKEGTPKNWASDLLTEMAIDVQNIKIAEHGNKLMEGYNQKVNETNAFVTVLNNTYAGTLAPKNVYIEMKLKNDELLKLGDEIVLFINENFDSLDPKTSSDFLAVIAENKGRFEMQNRFIDEVLKRYDDSTVKKQGQTAP